MLPIVAETTEQGMVHLVPSMLCEFKVQIAPAKPKDLATGFEQPLGHLRPLLRGAPPADVAHQQTRRSWLALTTAPDPVLKDPDGNCHSVDVGSHLLCVDVAEPLGQAPLVVC
jgi:hypothetical protein